MGDKQPIGYKVEARDGVNPPRVTYLVPPVPDVAREDQFYAIAGGDEYMVTLMRPADIKKYRRQGAPVSAPEAAVLPVVPTEFTGKMLSSLGLECPTVNHMDATKRVGVTHE